MILSSREPRPVSQEAARGYIEQSDVAKEREAFSHSPSPSTGRQTIRAER